MCGSCQECRHIIGVLHPGIGRIKDLRVGPQAMQNLAEEPLRRVCSAAFGQILGVVLFCQVGNLGSFGVTGVVFPQPGVSIGIVFELLQDV